MSKIRRFRLRLPFRRKIPSRCRHCGEQAFITQDEVGAITLVKMIAEKIIERHTEDPALHLEDFSDDGPTLRIVK